MQTVIIVIHLMIVSAMIGLVLLQRSEGGGLGMGGGGGGFLTSRGTSNVLTRTTAILAAVFFATSLVLSILAGWDRKPRSILQETAPGVARDQRRDGGQRQGQPHEATRELQLERPGHRPDHRQQDHRGGEDTAELLRANPEEALLIVPGNEHRDDPHQGEQQGRPQGHARSGRVGPETDQVSRACRQRRTQRIPKNETSDVHRAPQAASLRSFAAQPGSKERIATRRSLSVTDRTVTHVEQRNPAPPCASLGRSGAHRTPVSDVGNSTVQPTTTRYREITQRESAWSVNKSCEAAGIRPPPRGRSSAYLACFASP